MNLTLDYSLWEVFVHFHLDIYSTTLLKLLKNMHLFHYEEFKGLDL